MSVVIPTYNSAGHVARAIESVLAQSRKAEEIIVVDDGSTDDTATVVRGYGQQVQYLRQDKAGPGAARNAGIAAATGEWVGFLDADDEWQPEKLARQVALFKRNPDLVWTTGNFRDCLCGQGRCEAHVRQSKVSQMLDGGDCFDDFFAAWVKGTRGCTDTMLIKRKVLREVGPFATDRSHGEDLDMWWRIAYQWGRIGYDPEPLATYHLGVAGSLTQQYMPLAYHYDLIERHLQLSQDCGQEDRFRPCAAYEVHKWIRAGLFAGQGKDVRDMLRRFAGILPGWYRGAMFGLSICPKMTQVVCNGVSAAIRALRLKRQVTRPPQRG